MDVLKKFGIYILMIVGFIIFSEFLIMVALNSNYSHIERLDNESQIVIYQAQATKVNGRVRGVIKNSEPKDLTDKYLKFEFYSKRNIYLGKKYVDIENFTEENLLPFEVFFKLEDVETYKISIVDKKEIGELELIPKEFTRPEILMLTAVTLLIFW